MISGEDATHVVDQIAVPTVVDLFCSVVEVVPLGRKKHDHAGGD